MCLHLLSSFPGDRDSNITGERRDIQLYLCQKGLVVVVVALPKAQGENNFVPVSPLLFLCSGESPILDAL